ncbi:MAG: substrate-binding domain-containing protein [Candidatus Hydrogenedentes bacterium]|nr:substrate-binding domain-containing protein [Candidatus Hydrogenedentota bacterium]
MRDVAAICCLGLIIAVASGCEAGGGGKVIGAAMLTATHVFYQDLVEEMEAAAKEQGFTLRVQYAEFNSQRQVEQIEMFIAQGVNALIIAPTDSSGMGPAIAAARARGIPVFTADIAAKDADVVSHIASDNHQGGAILAEYLAGLLGGKGTVAVIDNPEATSVQDRVRGFEETLAKHPDIRIVQKAPGEGQRDKAHSAAEKLLSAYPDLSAIFGVNDDSALGALAAVEAAGLQDKVIVVGFDGTPEARAAIQAGKALKADTVQYPREIGRKTIETVAAFLRGERVPKQVDVQVGIIDKAKLDAEQGP